MKNYLFQLWNLIWFFIYDIDIPNILIIAPSTRRDTDDTFDLITSRFATRYNANDSLYLDTFDGANGEFASDAILFPNKFSNLEGRIMRVALFNYKPYTIWYEVVRIKKMIVTMSNFNWFIRSWWIENHFYFSLLDLATLMQLVRVKRKPCWLTALKLLLLTRFVHYTIAQWLFHLVSRQSYFAL